jgi:hypothetical protein
MDEAVAASIDQPAKRIPDVQYLDATLIVPARMLAVFRHILHTPE